jgi:beta-glucosidase/6-phospho-beta-glucosidase/beta-galactosidase
LIADKLDFIGINYYGKEYMTMSGSGLLRGSEYSESGRAISPEGFYNMLSLVHERYNVQMNRTLDIIITENGVSDETDNIRPAFIIEHLMVIDKGS